MKNKISTIISILIVFLPWTIFPLRTFDWALESPMAEIIVSCYAGFMILGGIFTIISYNKAKLKTNLMKICLMINTLYAIGGAIVLGMIFIPKII
ncbi:hypothetical protein NDGK_00351 [Clostridiales bacterium CHKCI001]|nr:hypothetical protein NDGK_00351 [Clostridiales bacterium CHKCI001]